MKICIECRWAQCQDRKMPVHLQYWTCAHPNSEVPGTVNLVTGQVAPVLHAGCSIVRNMHRGLDGREWCGPDGRFWEPIIGDTIGFGEALTSEDLE